MDVVEHRTTRLLLRPHRGLLTRVVMTFPHATHPDKFSLPCDFFERWGADPKKEFALGEEKPLAFPLFSAEIPDVIEGGEYERCK